jgi:hypothetical protein
MQIKNYWVGDKPGGNWVFEVLDQRSGLPVNLAVYSQAKVVMMDSDNNRIEFPTANVVITDPVNGIVNFAWSNADPFTKAGRYVVQLELSTASVLRKTTVQEILVREIGGVTR